MFRYIAPSSGLRQCVLTLFSLLFFTFTVVANDYDEAWKALNRNDREGAQRLFEKALDNPATATDAAIMLLRLNMEDSNDAKLSSIWDKAMKQMQDPYPYLYALWFNEGTVGGYGKKNQYQLKLIQKILEDPNCPGFMKSSIHYLMGHHYLTEGEFDKMKTSWLKVGQLNNWQFVGPFDNLGGSGFDKNYPPIEKPEPTAKFKSERNSDIWWFSPTKQVNDGWIIPSYFVPSTTAIVFAQSFVTADSDKNALLCAGFTGNIKVWLNDRLLISEQEPRRTDLDTYRVPCKLKKGVNRLLVQLGTEDESYGNFAVRITDEKGIELNGLTNQANHAPYAKDAEQEQPKLLPFYGKMFFQQKIKEQPENLLNYILLNEVYMRSKRAQEALGVIEDALAKAPENSLLRLELIGCLSTLESHTELDKQLQYLREKDPNNYLSLDQLFDEQMENEKYDAAWDVLNQMISTYGKSEDTYKMTVRLYGVQNKVEELVSTIDEGYKRYPESVAFAELKHNVAVVLRKDVHGAMSIFSAFLKKNYNVKTAKQLANEYMDAGLNDKSLKILSEIAEVFPYDPSEQRSLFNYYYGVEDFKRAQQILDAMKGLAPFSSENYSNQAELARQLKKESEALANFQKALHYRPNDFDSRRKIREIEKKPELATFFPQYDIYDLIKKSKQQEETDDYGYSYIIDERCTILYPERCSETIYTEAYRILTEKGIETWSEASIGYNSWRQRLIIEKAEVVKANGSKITAEQSGNDLVFPNLEIGDAVYFKYRIVSYAYGRMAREFWDNFYFNSFVHSNISRYCLLVPKDITIDFKTPNIQLDPVVSEVENFKLYRWERQDIPAVKGEDYMPSLQDVGQVLYVSTIPNWQEITNWYSDLSATQAKEDYEVKKVIAKLFPAGQTFTEAQKARAIYDYVVKNIQYSSVSFRQSAYVPQRASKVIQTKLGDCKDVSTLFATLAREAGLKANLVLVNTRDNGEETMPLPAVEFNHCIVKVMIAGQPWYLELTDRYLPFGCLPDNDIGAQVLEIPFNEPGVKAKLFRLAPNNRIKDYVHQTSEVNIKNRDLNVNIKTINSGNAASSLRYSYGTLGKEKQVEELQKSIARKSANPITVKEVKFGSFNSSFDTLHYNAIYTVKNEVIEIGEMKSFKTPFFYVFLDADNFTAEERAFPISYWKYEDKDEYLEDLTISLPDGKQFTEMPKDVDLNFNGTTYTIKYKKIEGGKIKVVRAININRDVIPAADYPAFKQFLEDALAAESKYLAYK
jgi:transglutaminase-like putative cysteine protease/thioredoxin-like negative regulator of GroEL